LRSQDANELADSMREWVDPCNNFLFADVQGNIGYLCRGEIPIRSMDNARLPVPGWTGEHEWQGNIPFEELPRSINPEAGYIATANNKPVDDDYPYYISVDFSPGFRVERVTKGLLALEDPTAADMAQVHAERLSLPALTFIEMLKGVEPPNEASAQAREKLLAWDGRMDADRVEPTLYSAFRDALMHELLWHNLGEALGDAAWHLTDRGKGVFYNRLKTLLIELIPADDRRLLPPGTDWPTMLGRALAQGVAALEQQLGKDPAQWRWDRLHQARPRHTLSATFPELEGLLDPPPIPMHGDSDTPLAGSYSPDDPATVTGLSVARYSFDLADWSKSLWAIPLGASGHPGSPHYHDQSETWRQVQMVPMEYDWEHIVAKSESQQKLEPA
ncbi:MAG: penicillin acylase family protein, partial [Dehalococcoidia bacterium]